VPNYPLSLDPNAIYTVKCIAGDLPLKHSAVEQKKLEQSIIFICSNTLTDPHPINSLLVPFFAVQWGSQFNRHEQPKSYLSKNFATAPFLDLYLLDLTGKPLSADSLDPFAPVCFLLEIEREHVCPSDCR
jgi:hypothetical protein